MGRQGPDPCCADVLRLGEKEASPALCHRWYHPGVLVSGTELEKQGRKNLCVFFFFLTYFFGGISLVVLRNQVVFSQLSWNHVCRDTHQGCPPRHIMSVDMATGLLVGAPVVLVGDASGEQIGGGRMSRGRSCPPRTRPRLPLPGRCGWARRRMWDSAFAGSLAAASWAGSFAASRCALAGSIAVVHPSGGP